MNRRDYFNRRITIASIIILIGVLLSAFIDFSLADYIQENSARWREYYSEVDPPVAVHRWYVPFNTAHRGDIRTVRVISSFGTTRYSYVRGHIHTGVDIVPRRRTKGEYVYVYPLADGVICSIHLGHPHRTVVIKHRMLSGAIIFTSYKHLQEIYVKSGERVDPSTRLARLYTREEALALGGSYDHLHLEIRKRFDDFGVASWATMNREQLKMRFYDPWVFMRRHVK
jgi:murein DD-endopeptidase MepM/ murein hydrolase activator NlpD